MNKLDKFYKVDIAEIQVLRNTPAYAEFKKTMQQQLAHIGINISDPADKNVTYLRAWLSNHMIAAADDRSITFKPRSAETAGNNDHSEPTRQEDENELRMLVSLAKKNNMSQSDLNKILKCIFFEGNTFHDALLRETRKYLDTFDDKYIYIEKDIFNEFDESAKAQYAILALYKHVVRYVSRPSDGVDADATGAVSHRKGKFKNGTTSGDKPQNWIANTQHRWEKWRRSIADSTKMTNKDFIGISKDLIKWLLYVSANDANP